MHWYYTKEHTDLKTPSRADGIDCETEMRYRKEGARFIMDLGNKLGLRYLTMATGIVFFHRFYMFQSFKNFPRYVTGTACIFLAGKVEETPKKCKDLLRMCRSFLSDSQFESFGENPREEVMMLERILLQTIKFDLQVDHPYQYLIQYGKGLKGDKQKINELVQKAWIFINDSLSTCICLHYQPSVVSLAMLNLAAKLSKQSMQNFTPVPRQDWWRHFSPETEQSMLDDICNEMMDLYEPSRRKSKSREGSVTDSPAYTSSSPKVTGSPPVKKKRSQSSSLADASKPKDSPLAKPPQVENVSPPVTSKAQPVSTPLTQPPPPPQIITQSPHGTYQQRGHSFMGAPTKDLQRPEIPAQHQNTTINVPSMMQSPQTLGNVYHQGVPHHGLGMPAQGQVMHGQVQGIPSHSQGMPSHGQGIPSHGQGIPSHSQGIPSHSQGIPSHGQGIPPLSQGIPPPPPNQGIPIHNQGIPVHNQVIQQHGQMMPPQDQLQRGGMEQPPYSYVAQQQPHMHGYPPSQMPHGAPQWQGQQPGMGPGWMK